jgi:F-type H+-transporting ATPase subunit epsilon
MGKQFHLDIITPTSTESFDSVEYVRIPSSDGLLGIKAKHAQAIIGLDVGEIRITRDGENYFYATSGGFIDIANEGVQLLLETIEEASMVNQDRATDALGRAKKRIEEQSSINLERANKSVKRAQNRIRIAKTFSENFKKTSKK